MAHYGEGRWTDISLQVQEVYNSSLVGQSLMEKAIVQVSYENDSCAVDALIEKLKNSEEKLTVELFAQNRTEYIMCNIGESYRARVQSKMLDCMGTVQTPMPLTVSCDKLELLSKSRLLVFSGAGLQSLMHSVLTFVLNLKDGIPPKLERAGDSPFIESVKGRLASYFSVLVPQAASSGAATTLYGEEAAKALYDTIANAFSDDPEEVVSADIARLQCYHWLLTSDQLAELRKIATSTMARAGNAAATKARRSRRAAASTDSQAAVASLFQRR